MKPKNIGVDIKYPEKVQEDKKSPFYGDVKLRGRQFTGTVVSAKMRHTAVVEWEWKKYLKKYQRYQKKRTRIKAHNPPSIDAREGDIVTIMESRPLSKTKNFVIIAKQGTERGFVERMRLEELGKVQDRAKSSDVDEEEQTQQADDTPTEEEQ